MNTTYLAITIGPIYKTFAEAKRTRAVWAASYFFSWFMRNILDRANQQKLTVFLPYSNEILKGSHGSGFYADRLYFIKDENTTKENLQKVINDVIAEVAEKTSNSITDTFLNSYLNLHLIETEITEEQLRNNKDAYPLQILNQVLDNKELHQNYTFNFEANPLQQYFEKKTNDSFLAKDAFGENTDRHFYSISEIATESLNRIDSKNYKESLNTDFKLNKKTKKQEKANDDTDFLDILSEKGFREILKPHHKYFAVIYADGDNIGELLKEINKHTLDIKEFSKTLFEFGKKAEEVIYNCGGNGIYLGGEDVLAFAPAACLSLDKTKTHTLFYLIQQLDIAFEETVAKYAKDNTTDKIKLTVPTVSYGVMLSYYKNPLKEAMTDAHMLLDEKAKSNNKNAIAFRFQKHSGQYMECTINKHNTTSTNAIYSLIEKYCNNLNKRSTDILSSIIQHFRDEVFVQLYITATVNNNLEHFFSNFFNEKIHINNVFLDDVKLFSHTVISDYPESKEDCKNIIYTVLRYIHFINSNKEQ
ncbi:MAG TPA: type III-B CRISPR-associated protein Cas10/Cmr2 [Chitinophagales bacterium]|nr:type III-B CRISPR-associated protein Cas10/Cmr2 [Chitinophagales bacterium]